MAHIIKQVSAGVSGSVATVQMVVTTTGNQSFSASNLNGVSAILSLFTLTLGLFGVFSQGQRSLLSIALAVALQVDNATNIFVGQNLTFQIGYPNTNYDL